MSVRCIDAAALLTNTVLGENVTTNMDRRRRKGASHYNTIRIITMLFIKHIYKIYITHRIFVFVKSLFGLCRFM